MTISGQRLPVWNGDAADEIPVEQPNVVVILARRVDPRMARSLSEKRELAATCTYSDHLYLVYGSHGYVIGVNELRDLLDRRAPLPVKVELELDEMQVRAVGDVERRLNMRTSSTALQVSPQATVAVSALLREIIDQASRRHTVDEEEAAPVMTTAIAAEVLRAGKERMRRDGTYTYNSDGR